MSVGRVLVGLGILLVVVGLFFVLGEKLGLRPGRLPGDVAIERGNFRFYFPIVTSILLSLLLTFLLWLFGRR